MIDNQEEFISVTTMTTLTTRIVNAPSKIDTQYYNGKQWEWRGPGGTTIFYAFPPSVLPTTTTPPSTTATPSAV